MSRDEDKVAGLRFEADKMLDVLGGNVGDDDLRAGRDLVQRLRSAREFAALTKVAEAVVRQAPKDTTTRRHYAQGLIETGHAMAAVDVLRPLASGLSKDDSEWAEANGLIGRAYKQVFFDAGDKTAPAMRDALERAIEAYRVPFEMNPKINTWHGINVVALLTVARRMGLRAAQDLEPAKTARLVLTSLDAVANEQRDGWYHATAAEAYLALNDWDRAERHLSAYLSDPTIESFHVGGTIRQFTEVWNLEADKTRGKPLVAMLRAQMMKMPGGSAHLSPKIVHELAESSVPDAGQLEAVLGADGAKTYKWMQAGMERARSVAAVRAGYGSRHGTAFLVCARSLGFADTDELVLVTNHHVVNADGSGLGIRPNDAKVVFEAVDEKALLGVTEVLWSSPPDKLDASVLRLASQPVGIEPLPVTSALPVPGESQRVYVIGYPGGRDLAFSFQDNALIDHEGPPTGQPPISGVRRIHYRAPTEGGSSGSPVFNEGWDVIGLHHLGGKMGVCKLNGKPGTYAANEGIWIHSVATAVKT